MIKLIKSKDGYEIAVLKDDTHQSRWCEIHGDILTDEFLKVRVLPLLKPGQWIVDAGANIGTHTVPYAKAVGETGKVIAFEPLPHAFACLMVNVRDLDNVMAFSYGLSDDAGFKVMELDHNVGASHIVSAGRIEPAGFMNDVMNCYFMPLDFFGLTKLDFLKIDVEGHEPEVINGARHTIKQCRPKILCEINKPALERAGHTVEQLLWAFKQLDYKMTFLEEEHGLHLEMVDALFLPL